MPRLPKKRILNSARSGTDETLAGKFSGLRRKLLALEKVYNPDGQNLHFEPLSRADAALYQALLDLAKEGLEKVHRYRVYFSEHPLYDDGMFWYDLLLLTSAAGCRMHARRRRGAVPAETVTALIEALVEVSEFPLRFPGDMINRNFEALGNTLWAFWSNALVDAARKAAHRIGSDAERFVENTLVRVRELRSPKDASPKKGEPPAPCAAAAGVDARQLCL